MYDPKVLLDRWFIAPLNMLRESLPSGDGAFVALLTSCPLYERYAAAVITKSGHKADKDSKIKQFMLDFAVDRKTADAFWDVIRDGLAHQAMPLRRGRKTFYPRWWFVHEHLRPIALVDKDGETLLAVQPWLFMEKVISLWESNGNLLTDSKSFPWGNIYGM